MGHFQPWFSITDPPGTGSDTNLFKLTWWSAEIAEFFTERGWMVVFPQRRGRGRSDGLYDESFTQNRSGYTCNPSDSLQGMERALTDIDQVVAHLKQRPEVLPGRMQIGGQSRGGILSVVYAVTRPDVFDGVINFVGGWMSDSCNNPQLINTVCFRRGAPYPHNTLWLYGLNDPFYSFSHSQSNFDAFIQAGGIGEFKTITPFPGFNGQGIIFTPDHWRNTLAAYLDELPFQPNPEKSTITELRALTNDRLQVGFTTLEDQRYRVLTSSTLSSPTTWTAEPDIIIGDGNNHLIELSLSSPLFISIQAH